MGVGKVSNQAVWEDHKAVIRGKLVAHGSCIKKEKQKEIADLLDKIHQHEVRHKAHIIC